jgi:hypothetical protein
MTSAKLSVDGSFRDMYIFTTGLRKIQQSLIYNRVGVAQVWHCRAPAGI